jgi:crotonobetainyl-CoA:carnitine CoA-transferase CaiB-like acyl-CoA transferase
MTQAMQQPGPLSGVKVADFSWIAAGPMSARWLADYGATVVKVESMGKVDGLRKGPPFAKGKFAVNQSAYFAACNANKYGITMNLNKPSGLEAARRLIRWSDVLIENFTPGQMAKWGLDYNAVRKINPGIIMISLSIQGQTGPLASLPGLGPMLAGLVGFANLTGYPDGPPSGVSIVYTDATSPQFASLALSAALDYRARTGKGQYIDLSQFETSVYLLGDAILDWTCNGRNQNRAGNKLMAGDLPRAAPHGAYPCKGTDRWVAIGVFSQEEWRSFCRVIGSPAWTRERRFATVLERCKNSEALDALIAQWTAAREAKDVMEAMQAAGVAAGLVHDQRGLYEDPQLNHRGHYGFIEHAEIGRHHTEMLAPRLSLTPGSVRMPAPCLGEHSELVYKRMLGYTNEQYDQLIADGVVELWEAGA